MKRQLTPTQTLWMFGCFAFLTLILASYTFLSFWQAFRMNSDVPAPLENEITSKSTLLEHGVNVTRTSRNKVSISDGQTEGLEIESQEEQPSIEENTPSASVTVSQQEKTIYHVVSDVPSVEIRHDKLDEGMPAENETQNEGKAIQSDENRESTSLASTNVQKHAPVILTTNATARSLPSHDGGNFFAKFPECRLYNVAFNGRSSTFKDIFEDIDSLTSLIAVIDKNAVQFDLAQPEGSTLRYNMIVWDGWLKAKKAGTYTFMLTPWSIPYVNSFRGSFGITVNGKSAVVAEGERNVYQGVLDVDMKIGYNKVRLCFLVSPTVAAVEPQNPHITYKLRNAVGEPRELQPAMLFHKVEEADW